MSAAPIQYLQQAGDIAVRVRQWGDAGPVALFVHGLGSHAEIWDAVAAPLARAGRRCLAIDLPGHGLSDKRADFDYSAPGHAAMLSALVTELGESRVDLVGSSLGGLHAAAFATTFPDQVASLCLVGSVGLAPMSEERRRWTADYLARMDRKSIVERLRRGVFDPACVTDAYAEETWRMNNSPGADAAFAAIGRYYLGGINDDVQLERLRALEDRFPLLLLWGKDDVTVAYEHAVAAARSLPHARLLSLDQTCHIPHIERPQAVVDALAAHFSQTVTPSLAQELP